MIHRNASSLELVTTTSVMRQAEDCPPQRKLTRSRRVFQGWWMRCLDKNWKLTVMSLVNVIEPVLFTTKCVRDGSRVVGELTCRVHS